MMWHCRRRFLDVKRNKKVKCFPLSLSPPSVSHTQIYSDVSVSTARISFVVTASSLNIPPYLFSSSSSSSFFITWHGLVVSHQRVGLTLHQSFLLNRMPRRKRTRSTSSVLTQLIYSYLSQELISKYSTRTARLTASSASDEMCHRDIVVTVAFDFYLEIHRKGLQVSSSALRDVRTFYFHHCQSYKFQNLGLETNASVILAITMTPTFVSGYKLWTKTHCWAT